jgi:hypothetical protein
LLDKTTGQSCQSQFLAIVAGQSWRPQLPVTVAGHSCWPNLVLSFYFCFKHNFKFVQRDPSMIDRFRGVIAKKLQKVCKNAGIDF